MWTKADVIQRLVETQQISKAEAGRRLDAVLEAIQHGVATTGKVQIMGHGTYEKRERAARKGRNPKTGEQIDIAAKKRVGFKSGKAFNDKL